MGSSGSRPGRAPGRPLVGVTAYGERASYLVWEHDTVLLPRTYPDAVFRAGGVPVLLPPRTEAADAVDRLDALVLAGGPDIDPDRYGAERDPHTGPPRPERDAAEYALLRRALEVGIPVLGVCRGIQVLNTALGGTLRQHLPDALGHTGHNPTPGVFGTVDVALEPGSRVHGALGERVRVQCHHHQGLDRLGDGLVVTGLAADGTIEAVELTGREFVVGVQWHPEQDVVPGAAPGTAQDDRGLFAALVAAARDREREHV
ncbi:gamma-glutamyl-gamma-aminobutyrate hydrolase family protein [Pseudonocardia humida]|uniref:Gamma-glutamyl-gamma-aminobutyrate hydrolase family protein n=1 Tax=Pseudonocardia humida TaxID=2800819 RepID=A0ABT1A5Y3_9PSEU|nr:gamma-glutamyl-gamma-aminobutyrate hydrolase family protein [Pseudonocardia humida]MCO1658410.1 gamma-glutamyl-gamma-aminobutyrate hydrolase family protein [Pseudonocardia humida]